MVRVRCRYPYAFGERLHPGLFHGSCLCIDVCGGRTHRSCADGSGWRRDRGFAMLDEATLRQLYLEEQRSIRDIAAKKGIATRTVYDLLIRYRIPRRPAGFHSMRAESAYAP